MTEQERFEVACATVLNQVEKGKGIGRLGEKALHAIVKLYLEPDVAKHEVKLASYFADIFTGERIVEIQTRQFSKLRAKLEAFLPLYPVTIVYPIPARKWLVWIDPHTGEATKERLSPKRGNSFDSLKELYAIKPYLNYPNLTIELLYVDVKEYRLLDGWNESRKKGSSRSDRIPNAVVDSIRMGGNHGYSMLLPETIASPFTSADFAKHTHISTKRAQIAITILKSLSLIEACGKQGRYNLYERTKDKNPTDIQET